MQHTVYAAAISKDGTNAIIKYRTDKKLMAEKRLKQTIK